MSDRRRDGIGGRWTNENTGRGGPYDRHTATDFVPPISLNSTQIDALLGASAVAHRIIWREPEDALRKGFDVEWDGIDPTLNIEIKKWLRKQYQFKTRLAQARAYARGAGGAAILIVADDGLPMDAPLYRPTLKRVLRLVVKDRFEVWPDTQFDVDPSSPFYGSCPYYHVQGMTRVLKVHTSRLVRFDGYPVSDRLRSQRNGWGGSILDLVYAQLRNYECSHEDAAEALTLLTQGVFTMDGFADAVEKDDADFIQRRIAAMRLGMGTLRDIILDPSEKYVRQSATFSGMGELLDKLERALVVVSGMPRVIFLGEDAPGLNGGSGGDAIRGWYDFIGEQRDDVYGDPVLTLVGTLLAQPDSPTGGWVPSDLGIDWPPMWSSSPSELAAMRTAAAQARSTDINSGVVSTTEARTDSDLAEHYDLANDLEQLAPPASVGQAAEPPAEPDVMVEDEAAIPAGETPISAVVAARRLGYGSSSPIMRLINEGRIRVWQISAGSPYRVLFSEVQREAAGRAPLAIVE